MPSLPKDNTNWLKSQPLIENFYKKNKDFNLRNRFSNRNPKLFVESLETVNKEGKYEVYQYKIIHLSGWTFTYEFLKMRGILDVPVFITSVENDQEKHHWFYKKQLDLYSDFNKIF